MSLGQNQAAAVGQLAGNVALANQQRDSYWRETALRYAIQTAQLGDQSNTVLDRARDYLAFICASEGNGG